jgi:ketosteroid isomerase-like protein
MSNVETMQQIYEAFRSGDIPEILERLAEDVRWEQWPTGNAAQDADVPYMRLRRGREAVAGFFQDIQEDFELNSFNPHSFLEGDGGVAVLIEVDGEER